MVAAEFVAIPLRGFLGVGPDAFEDEKGNKLTAMEAIMGRLLAIPADADTVKQFEFASAQLSNFTGVIDKLASLTASIAGLPPHYMGMATDNPPSAEAIAASESRLAARAERAQDSLGCGALDAGELILKFTKAWDPEYAAMRLDWRDVRTPTEAAKADAAVKLNQAKILPLRQTRQRLGYDDDAIDEMELEDEAEAQRSPAGQLVTRLADQAPGAVGA